MSIRLLTALASVVMAVLGVVFLLPPRCAYACSCGPTSIQGVLSRSEAVFFGGRVLGRGGGNRGGTTLT